MKKGFNYNCKENDAIIKYLYSDGKIQEVWLKIKGETSWTVIGYDDLVRSINEANKHFFPELHSVMGVNEEGAK